MRKKRKTAWGSPEQIVELRDALRRRTTEEALECALQSESVAKLVQDLQVDLVSFRQFWLQPLVMEGVTVEVAVASIARSLSHPN